MSGTKIEGGDKLKARAKTIKTTATNELEQAILNGALRVERDYKLNVSQAGLVDTGRWIGSITHRADGFGTDNPSVQVGAALSNPPYQKFHEFGTSKLPAQYPLTRAFNVNKQIILKDLARAFRKGVGL